MKKKFNLKEKFKNLFSKIGAFFKHIWKKYRENWFRIVVCLIALFVASCGFFRSCKNEKSGTTLQASADEVSVTSSESVLNPIDYNYNVFPYYTGEIFNDYIASSGVDLSNLLVINEDGRMFLKNTLEEQDVFFKVGTLSVANGDLKKNSTYYFKSVSTNGGLGFMLQTRSGVLLHGFLDTSVDASVDVYFRVAVGTYDNLDITPILALSTPGVGVTWTPPIGLILEQYYNKGYNDGVIETEKDYKLGVFRDARIDLGCNYSDGSTLTFQNVDVLEPITNMVTGVDLGKFIADSYGYNGSAILTSCNVTFRFSRDYSFYGVELEQYPLYLTMTNYITNLKVRNTAYDVNTWVPATFSDSVYSFQNGREIIPSNMNAINDYVTEVYFSYTGTLGNLRGLRFFTPNTPYDAGVIAGQELLERKVNQAYTKGFNAGYNRGRQVDSSKYSFVSLIDAVGYGITKPFVSILNFELLGMNMLSFVTGLLTLVLIVKLCSLFI